MQRVPTTRFTYEQYAAMERLAAERSEFVNGQIFAMSGTTLRHNEIIHNIFLALYECLLAKGCRMFTESVRTIDPDRLFSAYPDLMIVCGRPVTAIGDDRAVVNPMVIVEVQSESTAEYDRHSKFAAYRHIPTLVEYVLVAQDRPSVEVYAKREREGWPLPEPVTEGELLIAGCPLTVAQIYRELPE